MDNVNVAIVGIGLHPFGPHEGKSGMDMGVYAIREALKDAGIEWKDIQCAFGGSRDAGFSDSVISRLGPTGLPFTHIYNGCATGGNALAGTIAAIRAGFADVGLAVGFDKHEKGMFKDDPKDYGLGNWYADTGFWVSVQFFAMKVRRYMYDYNISNECLVQVAMKAYYNGSLNPKAWRRNALDREAIINSAMLNDPLRKYMVCSPSEGGAAVVVCRGDIAKRFTNKPIYVKGIAFRTRKYGSFEVVNPVKAIDDVPTPVEVASKAALEMAGIDPKEIQIAQLQDTEVGHEIMHMAETGLCAHGEQEKLIMEGATRIDGRLPINTDGGVLANGEPVGASGLRQVYEICLQLRGDAGPHQVKNNPKTGMSQVYGAPGVSAVVVLER